MLMLRNGNKDCICGHNCDRVIQHSNTVLSLTEDWTGLRAEPAWGHSLCLLAQRVTEVRATALV